MRQPIPFGKYLLLERISVGGMAEVFKAKAFGVEGFEKLLAIKRILPSMAEDADFIQMFIDEAKICGQLNHGNICQTFELGRIDDSHFIAMEYIWGKDLLQIQNRFRRTRRTMPPPMAAFIASSVCEGLDYAHRKKDATGKPLGIIHRDVSPQNILVSYDGEIKVIDFGIAKAASRSSKTQAGVLKGKFGYMSPEHVRGMSLDRRADIFAIGTILYEILTNERLFLGESDFATLEKVRNVDVPPPSTVNPEIPPTLDRIIMKALAREVEDRYQWASEMQEDLLDYLATIEPMYNSKALSGWMREQFSIEMKREAQILEEQRRIGREAMSQPGQPRYLAPPSSKLIRSSLGSGIPVISTTRPPSGLGAAPASLPPPPEPADSADGAADSALDELLEVPDIDVDTDDLSAERTSISNMTPTPPDGAPPIDLPGESTQILDDAQGLEVTPAGDLLASPTVVLSPSGPAPSAASHPAYASTGTPVPALDPFTATLSPSQVPGMAAPPQSWPIPPPSQQHFMPSQAMVLPGYPERGGQPYVTGGMVPVAGPYGPGYPSVPISNTGMVMLPGMAPSTGHGHAPLSPTPVRPNALWKDVLVGFLVAVLVVVGVLGVKEAISPRRGTIILTIFPPRTAEVEMDGRLVGRIQPGGSLLLRDVVRGTHQLRVRAEDGEGQQLVSVTSAEPLQITLQLSPIQTGAIPPAGGSGTIRLRISPEGALVSIDGRVVSEKDLLKGYLVAAGAPHEVRVSKAGKREQRMSISVGPGEEVVRDVELLDARGKLTVNTEPQGADISLDGQVRGKSPLTLSDLDPDKQIRVSIRRRGYAPLVKYITLDASNGYDQTLDLALNPASARTDPRAQEPAQPAGAPAPPQTSKEEPVTTGAVTTGENGYLVANTKPWARVFVDGKDTNRTTPIAPRDRIALRPGRHTVTFVVNQKKYTFQIVVKPGEEIKLMKELSDSN